LVNSVTKTKNDVVGGNCRDISPYYKDIKQQIVHALLLAEYGVSNKWVIIMDKRQDKNAASTQAETCGSSAQDHYCARGPGGGTKKWRGNGDE